MKGLEIEKNKMVKCGCCGGTGQETSWEEPIGKTPIFRITDCEGCKGTGKCLVVIEDKRKNSKSKRMVEPTQY